jgi:hypothetical protein
MPDERFAPNDEASARGARFGVSLATPGSGGLDEPVLIGGLRGPGGP